MDFHTCKSSLDTFTYILYGQSFEFWFQYIYEFFLLEIIRKKEQLKINKNDRKEKKNFLSIYFWEREQSGKHVHTGCQSRALRGTLTHKP